MFNRSQEHKKTCWSIVANLLSEISPSKLLVGYLYISTFVLNNFANAQAVVTKEYYLRGNRELQEPSSVCVNAAPGCVLSVNSIFKEGKLDHFKVKQECDESEEVTYYGRTSLGNQIKQGIFHGDKLCDAIVTNTVLKDSIFSRYRHNTAYSVDLSKDDRVSVAYRSYSSDPNCK